MRRECWRNYKTEGLSCNSEQAENYKVMEAQREPRTLPLVTPAMIAVEIARVM